MDIVLFLLGAVVLVIITICIGLFIHGIDDESPYIKVPCSWCRSDILVDKDTPIDYIREITCSRNCKDEKQEHYNDYD